MRNRVGSAVSIERKQPAHVDRTLVFTERLGVIVAGNGSVVDVARKEQVSSVIADVRNAYHPVLRDLLIDGEVPLAGITLVEVGRQNRPFRRGWPVRHAILDVRRTECCALGRRSGNDEGEWIDHAGIYVDDVVAGECALGWNVVGRYGAIELKILVERLRGG